MKTSLTILFSLGILKFDKYPFLCLEMMRCCLKVCTNFLFFRGLHSNFGSLFSGMLWYVSFNWTADRIERIVAGVCGTDGHVHEGEFITKFPVSN